MDKNYNYNLDVAITDDLVKINQEWYVVVADPYDTGKPGDWDGVYVLRKVGLMPDDCGAFVVGMTCGSSDCKVIPAADAEDIKLDDYVDMCCALPSGPSLIHYMKHSDSFKDDMHFIGEGKRLWEND